MLLLTGMENATQARIASQQAVEDFFEADKKFKARKKVAARKVMKINDAIEIVEEESRKVLKNIVETIALGSTLESMPDRCSRRFIEKALPQDSRRSTGVATGTFRTRATMKLPKSLRKTRSDKGKTHRYPANRKGR